MKTKQRTKALCILAALFLCALAAFAVDLNTAWHTLEGGGVSSGGDFTLTGVVGQGDTTKTVLSGGNFELEGGFLLWEDPDPATARKTWMFYE